MFARARGGNRSAAAKFGRVKSPEERVIEAARLLARAMVAGRRAFEGEESTVRHAWDTDIYVQNALAALAGTDAAAGRLHDAATHGDAELDAELNRVFRRG